MLFTAGSVKHNMLLFKMTISYTLHARKSFTECILQNAQASQLVVPQTRKIHLCKVLTSECASQCDDC